MPSLLTPRHGSPPPKAGMQSVIDRFVETSSMSTPGHVYQPPRAGLQPVTVRFGEKPTMSTLGRGSPPPKAGTQPINDRFTVIQVLRAQQSDKLLWKTGAQEGTDVRGSTVRSGMVASASGKGTKLRWDMKRGGRFDDTLDSGVSDS